MLAAFFNLRLCCKKLQNTTVLFRIDNTSAASRGNKQATHKIKIMSLIKNFFGGFLLEKE